MKTTIKTATLVLGSGLLLFGAGCGKSHKEVVTLAPPATEAAAEELEQIDPLTTLFMQVDNFMMGGSTNDALALLESGLANPEFAGQRQVLFSHMLRFLLYANQVELAEERMLAACRDDHSLAVSGLGLVYSYLMEQENPTNAVVWTERVLAVEPLPDEVRRSMREWNLMGYLSLGDDEKVQALVGQLLRDAPAGGALEIVARAVDTLFEQRRLDLLGTLLRQMSQVVTSDQGTQYLVLRTRLRLHAHRGEWEKLGAAFPDAAAKLPDGELQRLLRQLVPLAGTGGQTELIEQLCTVVIDKEADKQQSLILAGRQWVDLGMRHDPAVLPDRLNRLQEVQLPIRHLCGLFLRYFYDVIDLPETVAAMRTIGGRLAPLAEDDDTRNAIRTMLLDASYVLEDYVTALDILEKGIAGREASWHAMAISKVKAHKALQEKQPREAVKHFREFMTTIATAKDEEPTSDPATGLVHSKEMILGRNAKRIGDILAEIPDADAAQKAYAEARDYYKKALAEEVEPEAVKLINRELSEIP